MRISIKISTILIACTSNFLAYSSAQAGPCTTDIAQFESVMRQAGHDPDAGLTAPQSIGAQLGHQPTPSSVSRADSRLQSKFSTRLARARLLDAQGNPGCVVALRAAKKLYIP
jgi:hypothetical protein